MLRVVLAVLISVGGLPSLALAQDYEFKISAVEIDPTTVRLEIATDIPLPVRVAVSVGLKGVKPKETAVSTSRFIWLREPITIYDLDTSADKLPTGDYFAELSFHKRWGAEDGNPKAAELPDMEATFSIQLQGTGIPAEVRKQQDRMQRWVIYNVEIGDPWIAQDYIKQLGEYESYDADLGLHTAYYFGAADMTLIVSDVKMTISIWRMGRASR